MKQKQAIKSGLSFGLTSGVITTLGLIIGLNSGTHSRIAIIGGVIVIAFADALSDSMGIHLSKESEDKTTRKQIWAASIATFFSKLIIALSFLIPIIFLNLQTAILTSIIWGMLLITGLSYKIAKFKNTSPKEAIFEHLSITIIVIIISYYLGVFVENFFGRI